MACLLRPLYINTQQNVQTPRKARQKSTLSKSTNQRLKINNMTTMMMNNSTSTENQYDRAREVKQFDDSKIGVKGLVDSGLSRIPRFFVHEPDSVPDKNYNTNLDPNLVPTIDLTGVISDDDRSAIVERVRDAASNLGFFQIINHGITKELLDRTINSIRAFHELPNEVKSEFYRREIGTGVAYASNFDLFVSKAASWRDTIQIRLGPQMVDPEMLPEIIRAEVIEWQGEITRVAEVLMGLLSEGLGLDRNTLKDLTCLEGKVMVGHYYPYCPEPDLTVGISSHTDPGILTLLQQSDIGGLEIKYGDQWVIVKPVPGALVINIGDILQIMSNEVYKSVQHRVLSTNSKEPRISAAIFFNPSNREGLYGPLPELVTPETPALYQQFTLSDFMNRFFTKELDGKTMTNYYRI